VIIERMQWRTDGGFEPTAKHLQEDRLKLERRLQSPPCVAAGEVLPNVPVQLRSLSAYMCALQPVGDRGAVWQLLIDLAQLHLDRLIGTEFGLDGLDLLGDPLDTGAQCLLERLSPGEQLGHRCSTAA
jgi:hypothetical protein